MTKDFFNTGIKALSTFGLVDYTRAQVPEATATNLRRQSLYRLSAPMLRLTPLHEATPDTADRHATHFDHWKIPDSLRAASPADDDQEAEEAS